MEFTCTLILNKFRVFRHKGTYHFYVDFLPVVNVKCMVVSLVSNRTTSYEHVLNFYSHFIWMLPSN